MKRMLKVYWALFAYTAAVVYVIIRALLGFEVFLMQDELWGVFFITIVVFIYTGHMSLKHKR